MEINFFEFLFFFIPECFELFELALLYLNKFFICCQFLKYFSRRRLQKFYLPWSGPSFECCYNTFDIIFCLPDQFSMREKSHDRTQHMSRIHSCYLFGANFKFELFPNFVGNFLEKMTYDFEFRSNIKNACPCLYYRLFWVYWRTFQDPITPRTHC